MKVRVCPKCGKHNLEDAWSCVDCGETLSMNTLVDTESGQSLSQTPIAGHTTLSEISPHFEQDVIETLKTTVQIDESVLWGCNFAKPSKTLPFIFGYFIITSRQLILAQFRSDIRKDKTAGVDLVLNPLKFLAKELLDTYEKSTHPWTAMELLNIPYPSQPLTSTEKSSREVMTVNLKNVSSARIIQSWHKENLINSLVFGFEKSNEVTITFYSPHQAEKAYQVLTAQVDKKFS